MLLNIHAPDSLGYCSKMCILCSKELQVDVACGKKYKGNDQQYTLRKISIENRKRQNGSKLDVTLWWRPLERLSKTESLSESSQRKPQRELMREVKDKSE